MKLHGVQQTPVTIEIAPRNGRWDQRNWHAEADKLAELLRTVLPISTYTRLVASLKQPGGNRRIFE